MPKLTINDIEVEVEPGTSILQAAELLGIEIPRFCYHDKLRVPANCRMCLVEVEGGPPKPVASCAMACADNMKVRTDTPMIHKARKGVMEFLLINHPLDCPICDQGGECDLQDQAMAYGFDRSRYAENKRAIKDKDFGPLIKTQLTRCIQCTRCVRFGEDVAGLTELGLINRGEDVEISTFMEQAVSTELSGNMIDICPVGALTSKPYAFKARPWELRKTESVDVHDAVGSNIRVDVRGNEVMRILPRLNEDVNEEWISDKTRFAYDGLKKRRLDRPYVRDAKSGKLAPASWDEALKAVSEKLVKTKPEKIAALSGEMCEIESMVALKDMMNDLGVRATECRTNGASYETDCRAHYVMNCGISGLDEADAILLIGVNPRKTAAIINARIRKAWFERRVKIGLIGPKANLTYPYEHLGTAPQDIETLLSARKGFIETLKNAERPVILVGEEAFTRADAAALQALTHKLADKVGAVSKEWNGYGMLHSAASRVAALDIGFTSAEDVGGKDVYYLLGADALDAVNIPDKAFVIYQGHHGDAGAHRADVILPGAAYTEKAGLYVNTEGRVQRGRAAAHPPGEAREDWKIIRALSGVMGKALPYDNYAALYERITNEWEHLSWTDVLQNEPWSKLKTKANKLDDAPFAVDESNWYLTNPICRASETMHACVERLGALVEESEKVPEAAE